VFEHGYSTRPDGTGLGLAIVREVADAHDWSVSLVDDSDGARVAVTGVGPGAVEDDLTDAGRSD
jgi:signal transduction histidine kinase